MGGQETAQTPGSSECARAAHSPTRRARGRAQAGGHALQRLGRLGAGGRAGPALLREGAGLHPERVGGPWVRLYRGAGLALSTLCEGRRREVKSH